MKKTIIRKPWGEEHVFALNNKYAGKMLIIKQGQRLSLQYHRIKDETFYVLEGVLKVSIGKTRATLRTRTVKPGTIIHVPPGTIHRTEAVKDCTIIEVSTPELQDVVRLEDDYNRCTK
jgi:mannose-6-phosphate isomerase-like protein (cupin superfamily)